MGVACLWPRFKPALIPVLSGEDTKSTLRLLASGFRKMILPEKDYQIAVTLALLASWASLIRSRLFVPSFEPYLLSVLSGEDATCWTSACRLLASDFRKKRWLPGTGSLAVCPFVCSRGLRAVTCLDFLLPAKVEVALGGVRWIRICADGELLTDWRCGWRSSWASWGIVASYSNSEVGQSHCFWVAGLGASHKLIWGWCGRSTCLQRVFRLAFCFRGTCITSASASTCLRFFLLVIANLSLLRHTLWLWIGPPFSLKLHSYSRYLVLLVWLPDYVCFPYSCSISMFCIQHP